MPLSEMTSLPPSRHPRRRGRSSDPLSQPRVPTGVQGCREHNDGDLDAGDLANGKFSPVKAVALLGFTNVWGQVDYGPPLAATVSV